LKISEDDLDLVYEAVVEAAWDYDPSNESGTKFSTLVIRYAITKKTKKWREGRGGISTRQFGFDDEGRAVELKTEPAPRAPVLASLSRNEDFEKRMGQLRRVLSESFSVVEQNVFNLANGFDPMFPGLNLEYQDIAVILQERGLKPRRKVLSAARIEHIFAATTQKLIRLLNEPSPQHVALWRQFLSSPGTALEIPTPILRSVTKGKIPLVDGIELTDYKVKEGRPVFVAIVKSYTSVAPPESDYYVILEVSYRGEPVGASLLKFDRFHNLVDQQRKNTREEVIELLKQIRQSESEHPAADSRSELRGATKKRIIGNLPHPLAIPEIKGLPPVRDLKRILAREKIELLPKA